MFAVYRSSERPGKEERECKGDFQPVLEKAGFINLIYLNHLFEGEDCGFFCCLNGIPSRLLKKKNQFHHNDTGVCPWKNEDQLKSKVKKR